MGRSEFRDTYASSKDANQGLERLENFKVDVEALPFEIRSDLYTYARAITIKDSICLPAEGSYGK
jgi:hypothetical protein